MEIQKSQNIVWIIRPPNSSAKLLLKGELSDGTIRQVSFSQISPSTNVNITTEMSDQEFEQFYNLLTHFKAVITAPRLAFMPNFPSARVIQPQKSTTGSNVPPIIFPDLDFPEIYVMTKNGVCLWYLDLSPQPKPHQYDENLISGLVSAINVFSENMGLNSGINSVKSGNIEIRFTRGNSVLVAFRSSAEMNLGFMVEPIVNDFTQEICNTFEQRFKDVLDQEAKDGFTDIEQFKQYQPIMEEILTKYRQQTFELYQKLILTESLYLNIPAEICIVLIHKLSEGKSVVNQLAELIQKYPLIKNAIRKVNNMPFWKMFQIPIYEET